MTITPTLSGGLKLIPEEEQDWEVLLKIAYDGEGRLGEHFASLMNDGAMWEEIVVPELEAEFSGQREMVLRAVQEARGSEGGELVIEREDAAAWYGAFNQARLVLEQRHRFGSSELIKVEAIEDGAMRSAYFRNEFYGAVQSLLLEYVMCDD